MFPGAPVTKLIPSQGQPLRKFLRSRRREGVLPNVFSGRARSPSAPPPLLERLFLPIFGLPLGALGEIALPLTRCEPGTHKPPRANAEGFGETELYFISRAEAHGD